MKSGSWRHLATVALAFLLGCSSNAARKPGTGPGADVTPIPVPADPARCPAGFRTSLGAGHNAGFTSAGESRSFDLLLPSSQLTGPRPLLFAFHGTGLSGALAIADYGLQEWADAGFIVVAPDSAGNGTVWPVWDALRLPSASDQSAPNADLALFDDLLQCVAAHHAVDANRIYVAGHSAGGAMANFLLGHRSAELAGGVAASGAFDLTQAVPAQTISPVTVIVTWGGDNDVYSGAAGGASVDNIGYAEQSALASQYWEAQPGSHQLHCRGDNLGHNWLNAIDGWMIDVLLAHPKGAAAAAGWTMPASPSGSVSCSEAAATYTPRITVSCSTAAIAACQPYCQLLGDCLVENGTLGLPAAGALQSIGFGSSGNVCSGCEAACAADAQGSAADAAALACISSSVPTTTCGPGFAGAAVFGAVGPCCAQNPGSNVCARFCAAFRQSSMFASLLTGCP